MPSKIEKKLGKYAIPNLTLYLLIGYVIGYLILHGQIWRILTWVLTMPESLGIFTIIMLFLYYSLGSSLERAWGTYRYNVYLISGFLFTIVGSFLLYLGLVVYYSNVLTNTMYSSDVAQLIGTEISLFVSTYYINMSIFLAYAATYPDTQLMLYFLIPIKVKWFGYLYGGYIIYDIISSYIAYSKSAKYIGSSMGLLEQAQWLTIIKIALIIFSMLNFLIYLFRIKTKRVGQVKRKRQYTQSVNKAKTQRFYQNGAKHRCAVCGRTEIDAPELVFRYCSKCSGGKEYCQDHLFTHTHN